MYPDLYNFNIQSSFEIISGDDPIEDPTIMLDKESGALLVTTGDGDLTTFPLISEQGESIPVGIFLDLSGENGNIQIGEVEFQRTPLFVEYFPINESEFSMELKVTGGGHLGIIDIRDVGRTRRVQFLLHVLPVSITLEGNYLVFKTVKRLDSDTGPLWYEIFE